MQRSETTRRHLLGVIITLKPGDTFDISISQAAMGIIHSALALDARATKVE
jgi:hypothetical protein